MGRRIIRLYKQLDKDAQFICVDSNPDKIKQIQEDGHIAYTDFGVHIFSEVVDCINLSNCDNYQTEYLYKLPIKFNNLILIKPEEKIDTYELMDKSSKIIVLNSTMGVESAYWNKPVILLGHAVYEDLGCTYQPNSKVELWDLIRKVLEVIHHLS